MDNDRTYHRARLPGLHVAAKQDDLRLATILLQSGTKVVTNDAVSGGTPNFALSENCPKNSKFGAKTLIWGEI